MAGTASHATTMLISRTMRLDAISPPPLDRVVVTIAAVTVPS
jgi:hypothetical protein